MERTRLGVRVCVCACVCREGGCDGGGELRLGAWILFCGWQGGTEETERGHGESGATGVARIGWSNVGRGCLGFIGEGAGWRGAKGRGRIL
jgi:hypothetical protein